MSIVTGQKYVLQNVFTRNVITQLPGGAGPAGLCGWGHPWVPAEGMREWKLTEVSSGLYRLFNVYYPEFRIFGQQSEVNAPGQVGVTNGGTSTDQEWQFNEVAPDVYTIGNQAGYGYIVDANSPGTNSLLQTYRWLVPYNPEQFHWKLIDAVT